MTDKQNPYAAPQASVADVRADALAGSGILRAEPARLPAGAGMDWLGQSWDLFKRAPALLVLMLILYFLVGIGVQMIPLLGGLFMSLTFGNWLAGWTATFDKLWRGEEVSVGDLFAGFSHPRAGRLFTVGALYLGLLLVLFIAVVLLAVFAFGLGNFADFSSGEFGRQVESSLGANLGILLAVVLFFVTGLFLILGYIAYAPVLLAMHDIPVMQACSLSLTAMLRNWLPMTVFGLVFVGLCLASVFTLFLGMLVVMPLMLGVGYVSYRQMFLED